MFKLWHVWDLVMDGYRMVRERGVSGVTPQNPGLNKCGLSFTRIERPMGRARLQQGRNK